MNADFARWVADLKQLGYSDKVDAEAWGDGWPSRKHYRLLGADSSILEVTRKNVYNRVVASDEAAQEKPFVFCQFTSLEYPSLPKTDFYLNTEAPRHMSAAEVEAELVKLKQIE